MTLDDLAGKTFATVQEAAAILGGTDERAVRRAAAEGAIPSIQVGTRRLIPTSWLRQQAGDYPGNRAPAVDFDQLADRVAARGAARIFGALAGSTTEASPAVREVNSWTP
jgi:excisionase family DNA binding protein